VRDWGSFAAQCERDATETFLADQAAVLGVSVGSLRVLGAGYFKAWNSNWLAFPMRSGAGIVVGMRLRRKDGKKLAVPGGKEGLFVGLIADEPLLITEGPSDAAAAMDAWPLASVVGRPSCTGAEDHLIRFVHEGGWHEVVFLADQDQPGIDGAHKAARALISVASHLEVKVLEGMPEKDVRAMVRKLGAPGAGSALQSATATAAPYQMVRSVNGGGHADTSC
jgi:DNA primase